MEIIIGKSAGFCFGVKNAVTKTEDELKKNKNVCCLGELVHNKQVTEELIRRGTRFIKNLNEANGKVIIRSHGVQKQVYEEANKLNIDLIDLTCPKVLHIHKIAEEYAKKDYFIFLIGKIEHPEMLGTISFCGDNYCVIEKDEEIEYAIKKMKETEINKAVIISQTTFSLEKFNSIVENIRTYINAKQLEVKNTICDATRQRQEETEQIAKMVDVMVIVGGKHSSNSNKLYELAMKYCKNTIFVETADEIEKNAMEGVKKIGIMAGASTPQTSIEKIVEKIKEI